MYTVITRVFLSNRNLVDFQCEQVNPRSENTDTYAPYDFLRHLSISVFITNYSRLGTPAVPYNNV